MSITLAPITHLTLGPSRAIGLQSVSAEAVIVILESAFHSERALTFIRKQRVVYVARFTADGIPHHLKLTSHAWSNPLIRLASLLRLKGYPENVIVPLLSHLSADPSMSLVEA